MRRTFGGIVVGVLVIACGGFLASRPMARAAPAFTVSGASFRMVIDPARGGQVTRLELFDGATWNSLFGGDAQTFPAIAIRKDGAEHALDRATAIVETTRGADGVTSVRATATVESVPVTVTYEIHPEGAVFLDVAANAPIGLGIAADRAIIGSAHYRQETYASAGPKSARLAFGRSETFTNEVELDVEEGPSSPIDIAKGSFRWNLPAGAHHRLALGLGAAATRSNLIGERPAQWVNSVDPKRTDKTWYPSNDEIDAIVADGASILVLHAMWMAQAGSNGSPHADYRHARDEGELERTIEHAHARGLRVGLYVRGIERYALASSFFARYLTRDRDGLYVDWNGARAVSAHEHGNAADAALGDTHHSRAGTEVPAHDHFVFTKSLRALVGDSGFLIGHQGAFKSGVLANIGFDALLVGEAAADHAMFTTLDDAAYAAVLGGSASLTWPISAPWAFTSPEAIAKMAAWGIVPELPLGIGTSPVFPADPSAAENQYAAKYWSILAAGHAERSRLANSPAENVVALGSSDPAVRGVVYRKTNGDALVVVANLSNAPRTAHVVVVGLGSRYAIGAIDATKGAIEKAGTTDDGAIDTGSLDAWQIAGFTLSK